jgi:hypothetical protein
MTHPVSQKPKLGISPASTRLTLSEIKSLQQHKRRALAAVHVELARLEAARLEAAKKVKQESPTA